MVRAAELPELPELPDELDVPALPDDPDVPDEPDVPELPDVPLEPANPPPDTTEAYPVIDALNVIVHCNVLSKEMLSGIMEFPSLLTTSTFTYCCPWLCVIVHADAGVD